MLVSSEAHLNPQFYNTATTMELRIPLHWRIAILATAMMFSCLFTASRGLPDAALYAAEPVESEIRKWIDQLDSTSRATRITAEQQLLQTDQKDAKTLLQLIDRHFAKASPAQTAAMLRIQRSVEVNLAMESLQGHKVSLPNSAGPWTITQVIGAVSEQTAIRFEIAPAILSSTKVMELDLQNALFWNALDTLCRQANITWQWGPETSIQIIEPRMPTSSKSSSKSVTVAGPFRIAIVKPQPSDPKQEAPRTIRIKCRIDVEPGIHPMEVEIRDSHLALATTQGNLTPFNVDAKRNLPFAQQVVTFNVDFERGAHAESQVSQFSGSVQIRCQIGQKTLRFPMSMEPAKAQFAGNICVRRGQLTRAGEMLQFVLSVTYPPDVSWDSYQVGRLHRDCWLQTEQGQHIPYEAMSIHNAATSTHDVHFQFKVPEEITSSLTINYSTPILFTTTEVPFECAFPIEVNHP